MKQFFRVVSRLLLVVPLAFSLAGAGCTKLMDEETKAASAPVTITMWGVNDDGGAYAGAIAEYSRRYPNVGIIYRRVRLEDYETELLNALAEDRGPDVLMLHHDWANKYLTKIDGMPNSVRVAERTIQGTVKKEVIWQMTTVPMISNGEMRRFFVDTVGKDVIRPVNFSDNPMYPDYRERVIGVPTSIDTLAMYYNRSILNLAGIPLPPETWDEFQADVRKVTRRDPRDPQKLLQAGAGFGLGANVERSADIMTALITQNGAKMELDGRLSFHVIPPDEALPEAPVYGALRFYTEFADPAKDVYTWNADQPNSFDAFIQGKSAFFFGYSYQQDLIKARAPQLNIGISKLPQIAGRPPKNVANYWFWSVSRKSKHKNHAWNFINFLSQAEQQKSISTALMRPSPRRDVLAEQLRDDTIGTFASQVLTAGTWYSGRDPRAMEAAFVQMVDAVAKKQANLEDAVRFGYQQISSTY